MSEDRELEHLKRKKLLAMQKRLLTEKAAAAKKPRNREPGMQSKAILNTIFTESAWEIWQVAEQQFPQATEAVAKALATLVETGKIRGKVTGEQIYWLFRQIGIPVRLKTRIRILEGGELKTIADKLRGK